MARYDIAIAGRGLLPGLLAVWLAQRNPQHRLLLLCADDTACGDQVEPVIVERLSPSARALLEPFYVSQWPGYFIASGGSIEKFDEEVWLIDPVQLWLELVDLGERCVCVAQCGTITEDTGRLSWAGGEATADRTIDLFALTPLPPECEILGIAAVRYLGLPILADYDTASGEFEANQLLPLGDERVMVRKLPRRDDLVTANSSFESILNALTAD